MKELLFLLVLFVSNVIQAITGFAGTVLALSLIHIYPVNHAFGGYPQVTVSFESASYKDPKVVEMSPANISYTGSVEPENLRARFRTPVEVGWQWMAKLDHDFIGRKALEKEMSNPQKTIVSLIWNPEDILDVQAS